MQISSLLEEGEVVELQQKFYEYFETGYAFEEFLKEYLLKMGLDEVEVTQRSRDGGIDLKAIRKGVGDFSEIDITNYYIQAKRNAPKSKISVNKVRELKGTIPFGYKGMLITTADFTNDATSDASNDPSKPVVLINGKSLVTSCIDNEIGFIFKPVFSTKQMDKFLKKEEKQFKPIETKIEIEEQKRDYIEKTLTFNDIRARIISIPSAIIKQFDDDMSSVDVKVNSTYDCNLKIIRGRNYFGGVTELFKKFSLVSDDGVITAKQVRWYYDADNKIVNLDVDL